MNLAFLQIPLVWESPQANREAVESNLKDKDLSNTDLLILPETFTTGFSMKATHLAEEVNGETFLWMQSLAAAHNTMIAGSIMVKEFGNIYNRFLLVGSEGLLCQYDKKHLFGLGEEKELITAGDKRKIVDVNNWRINLQICYDLRFPVWMRNTDQTELILLVANWPAPRVAAWRSLLIARAIENQCYVLGVNRLGEDGNGLSYTGDSLLVDPAGQILVDAASQEGLFFASIDKDILTSFQRKFPFLKDADQFELK